jgi:hypothetical protein
MHYIILILSYLSARTHPRGAEIRNSSGASSKGVFGGPQASSDKDTNLHWDQDNPRYI